jgi:alkylation response protein AidB-like acyl-CoA dehydrogenase
MQVMGGEGMMTENELERIWRDSRINTIVEGANEVMHSFVFAYGTKQLAEYLLKIKDNALRPAYWGNAAKIGAEMFLGMRQAAPSITKLSPRLVEYQTLFENDVRELSHQVKLMVKDHAEQIVTNQMIQRRLSMVAVYLFASAAVLSRLDQTIRAGHDGVDVDYELSVGGYFLRHANLEIAREFRSLRENVDQSMRKTAAAVRKHIDTLPNEDFAVPERSPNAMGTGRELPQEHIKQFSSGSIFQGHNAANI